MDVRAQAAYHGVPLVGIPMYGDQPDNIAKAVHRGFGLLVPAKHLQVGACLPSIAGLLQMPCTSLLPNAARSDRVSFVACAS